MARLTRADKYEIVQRKLEGAARWRDEMGYDNLWRRMNDLYRGKHWPRTTANEDLVAVNLAFSTINVIAPSVSVNYPKVIVSPNKEENQDRATFVEAVINYLWRHHDFRKPFQRSVKDFLIFGHGWLKVGWKFVEQERQLGDAERDEMLQTALAEMDTFAEEDPFMAGELPDDEQVAANIPTTSMTVVEDQPFVERVSPFDIFVDPEATSIDDAKWIAQRIIRSLDEAKKDKRYKASARRNLSADSLLNPVFGSTDRQEQERFLIDDERTVVFEFYDIENNTMSVVPQSGAEFLVDPAPMPYAYGQPFVMMRNYDVPDFFYPMGDLESIESLQLELDKTRSQLVNARKRYARKYLFHERSFGPEGREALESDQDGRLVPVVDENKSLHEVVIPMPQTPLSADVYNFSAIIEEDINTVSGVSEYARGQMPEIRRTATEASIIADAGNSRVAEKLAIVEISIAHVARRVVQVMQQFMTGEQMARVAIAGPQDMFITYTRDDIVGEFDFSVEAGSTQPINDTVRRRQAVELMQALAPFVGTVVDPAALVRYVLQNSFGVKDPDKFLMQEQPMQPQGPEGMPEGAPQGMPEGMPQGMPPGGMPMGGNGAASMPPEVMRLLQEQMGSGS